MIRWALLRASQQKTLCQDQFTMGIANYIPGICRFVMSSAVLLAYDCHLQLEEIWSPTNRIVSFEIAPHTGVHRQISESRTEASPSLNVRIKTVKSFVNTTLVMTQKWKWSFSLSSRSFRCAKSQDYERSIFLSDEPFVFTQQCFRHGGATREFMLKRLSKEELKDIDRWKRDITFYTYV